jgi:hypothetical protein
VSEAILFSWNAIKSPTVGGEICSRFGMLSWVAGVLGGGEVGGGVGDGPKAEIDTGVVTGLKVRIRVCEEVCACWGGVKVGCSCWAGQVRVVKSGCSSRGVQVGVVIS